MRIHCQNPVFASLILVGMLFDNLAAETSGEAENVVEPTKLSLITAGNDLESVFAEIEKQTGNKLVDFRARFNQEISPHPWNFSLSDREFWPVLDKFLDAANLGLYNSSGEESLAVVNRTSGSAPRFGRACYSGPFRIEAVNIMARRSLRSPADTSAQLDLEIAWEPRLSPLSLALATNTIEILGDDQSPLEVDRHPPVPGAEVLAGSHAAEMVVPLQMPPRQVGSIRSIKGRLTALVPSKKAEFRFSDLAAAQSVEQTTGGVKVVLVAVRRNQALWEVRMRLEVDDKVPALKLQRGWAFQNLTFLENEAGEIIDHAGFETTNQTDRALGLAYFFDLPAENLKGYTWVYRTPAAISEVPVEFELRDISLP